MKIDKIQASTPNFINSNFSNYEPKELSNFNDLLLNVLNTEIPQINEINLKNDVLDKIKKLLYLMNNSNDNLFEFNNEKLNLNENDYKELSIILFYLQQQTKVKHSDIEINTMETQNKNRLNLTNTEFNPTTFENITLDYRNVKYNNIKDNDIFNNLLINKSEKIQTNNTFLSLNEVRNLINNIVKKEEINPLTQELNIIMPRYSFKIQNDKNMNQLIFDELENNVDILKSLDDQSILVDELPITESQLLNDNNFINTVKVDNKNFIMSNSSFYQIEKINEIFNIVASKIRNIKNEDIYELKINLKPRELGEINIKISYDNGNVNGLIIANNREVANLLKENISYLREQIYNNSYEYKEINLNVQTDNHNNNHNSNKNQNQKKKNHNNKFILEDE
ncbi:flagellar hook-length control protein FliK [Caloramator proteoclasticus]|uniref:Hook-length control protein FliK n=1 Tax=Caloramator proteoclasticus DSM 10124 TaxID=1121262 RepID=A0A1M4STK8_9CLOT|nr:flagellar hook-length control protein FliK [Caloramator proteoclasticus]SHE35570.1 hook-length control protein FliK [Caloramator proteoclasticus DSM 10124]